VLYAKSRRCHIRSFCLFGNQLFRIPIYDNLPLLNLEEISMSQINLERRYAFLYRNASWESRYGSVSSYLLGNRLLIDSAIPQANNLSGLVASICVLQFSYTFAPLLQLGLNLQIDGLLPEAGEGFDPVTGITTRTDKGFKRWVRAYMKKPLLNTFNGFFMLACISIAVLGIWASCVGLKMAYATSRSLRSLVARLSYKQRLGNCFVGGVSSSIVKIGDFYLCIRVPFKFWLLLYDKGISVSYLFLRHSRISRLQMIIRTRMQTARGHHSGRICNHTGGT
jgi:hypothetical protein